ncbi:hypothetical protein CAPTEDRAFT_203296 [Capitella teleta]|uniref:Protein quiver n=1 Tax=Capitella teleta TaxID=283909 RepID=R7TTD8_CAPTE|nr:hypothetical protein CAPTEDRAFT_203296 [Capitella teleta]|eukprot:ELT96924.1 hypothetical protein CAPTEDRAFT_203296 [Capitella teleta]
MGDISLRSVTPTLVSAESTYNCYACQYGGNPSADQSCIDNPERDPFGSKVLCGNGDYVCRTQRMWDKGDKRVRNFYRGCEPRSGRKDNCLEDTHWDTCETFCETELCNIDIPIRQPIKPNNSGFVHANIVTVLILFLCSISTYFHM